MCEAVVVLFLKAISVIVFFVVLAVVIWCTPLVQLHIQEHETKRKYPHYRQICGCSDEWILRNQRGQEK